MFSQDWTPVVFKKPKVATETQNKTASSTQQYNSKARKLEADLDHTITEVPTVSLNILSPEQRKELIAYRIEKKMNQSQLAKAINEQVSVINALETGKVVNIPNILTKVNKALGTKLKWPK